MKPKRRMEIRMKGWLPKGLHKSQEGSIEWAFLKARFSTAVKFRIAARVVIAAIFFPFFAFVLFSNYPRIAQAISTFGISVTILALVFIADKIAKKRCAQKTPAEVERF
jgi:hypothetical protein